MRPAPARGWGKPHPHATGSPTDGAAADGQCERRPTVQPTERELDMGRRSLTVRVARWSAIHPWRAMLLWLVFVAACFMAGSVTGTRQDTNAATNLGESSRAQAIIESGHFAPPAAVENVLITARSGAFEPAAAAQAAETMTTRMSALPQVAAVDPPAAAPNGGALLVRVTLAGAPDTAGDRLAPLQAATAAVQAEYPALRVEQ